MKVVRYLIFAILSLFLTGALAAQDQKPVEQIPVDKSASAPKNNAEHPPRYDDDGGAGESSSKQTEIDISPPRNDTKDHPEANLGDTGVDEFSPYNPMKAMKDVEVGDFYFKQQNYNAAMSRYREALEFKPHDAEATYKLAVVEEKTGDYAAATQNYQDYLKMLPDGPYAKKSKEALEKMKKKESKG